MDNRKVAGWGVTAISLLWIGGAGWNQFGDIPESEIETHSSAAVQDRLRDCSGSFKQRYDCKESIVLRVKQDTFNSLSERLAIVVVPPLLAALGAHLIRRRWRE
jgi:hypothetical protein